LNNCSTIRDKTNISSCELEQMKSKIKMLQQAEELAEIGSWRYTPATNELVWSEGMYTMLGVSKCQPFNLETCAANFVASDQQGDFLQTIKENIANGDKEFTFNYELEIEGQFKWLELKGKSIKDKTGTVLNILGTLQDRTEAHFKSEELTRLKAAIEQVKQKNNQLEEFTYIASHDLQEPVHIIHSMASTITKTLEPSDMRTQKSLQYLMRASKHMQRQIISLMNYAKIGKDSKLATIDCQQILTDVLAELKQETKAVNANIIVEKLPKIKGFAREMSLLFHNLISNALKFTKNNETPHIKISSETFEEYHQFQVTDNGIGIEEKYFERVFKIFQRLNSKKEGSTGIGLAHCRKIAELHQGKIWIESEVNKGTTFFFTIKKK